MMAVRQRVFGSWDLNSRPIINRTRGGTLIWINPLRSPMSIFSKSPDLEKCEAGAEV